MKVDRHSSQLPWWVFTLFALLYLVQVLPGINSNSLTNDEPVEITNGYYALTQGDVAAPHNYSSFATLWCAIPLLALPLKAEIVSGDVFDRAHEFLFVRNLDHLPEITIAARSANLLLGFFLGLTLWGVTKKEAVVSAAVLFFWALNPTILALSGLAKSDIPAVFLFFLSIFLFHKSSGEKVKTYSFLTGLVAALAVMSKFSCLILVPIFLILEVLDPLKRAERNQAGFRWKSTLWRWGGGAGFFFLAVFLIYLPASLLSPVHGWPWGYFFSKLRELALFDRRPYPVYFWGQGGFQNHWYYFPASFILKSPIPFLMFLLAGVGLAFSGKLRIPAWQWVPPLGFTLGLLPHLNEGIRFLAPALPFAFLIAGQGAAWLWDQDGARGGSRLKIAAVFLWVWQAASLLNCFPGYLSYFNDLVPPERKLFFLADSNLDWGQDLKRLASTAKERKWPRVRIAYLGAVDPSVYGLDWEPLREIDLKGPEPGMVYAVNASFFQLGPTAYPSMRVITDSWISTTPPTGKVADSWFYFEIPGKKSNLIPGPIIVSAPFLQIRGYRFKKN